MVWLGSTSRVMLQAWKSGSGETLSFCYHYLFLIIYFNVLGGGVCPDPSFFTAISFNQEASVGNGSESQAVWNEALQSPAHVQVTDLGGFLFHSQARQNHFIKLNEASTGSFCTGIYQLPPVMKRREGDTHTEHSWDPFPRGRGGTGTWGCPGAIPPLPPPHSAKFSPPSH